MKIKWLVKQIGTTIYKNRSNIEFVAGNVMVAVGTGMIISKAEEATEVKREIDAYKCEIDNRDEANDWVDNKERSKACFQVAKRAVGGYLKCYGPGLAVEIGGLTLMGISHATDRSEIASVSAALASTTMEFMSYRQRVREELGDEKDEMFLTGAKTEVIVGEDGKNVERIVPTTMPDHSFLFDESNPNWEKEGFMNRDFLMDNERWVNDKLWTEGLLWENDIRRMVDAPIDPKASQGDWGITAVDDDGNRNYISFGIQKDTDRAKAFREGSEKSFLVILNNMEPNISTKMYRLNKYHKDYAKQGLAN